MLRGERGDRRRRSPAELRRTGRAGRDGRPARWCGRASAAAAGSVSSWATPSSSWSPSSPCAPSARWACPSTPLPWPMSGIGPWPTPMWRPSSRRRRSGVTATWTIFWPMRRRSGPAPEASCTSPSFPPCARWSCWATRPGNRGAPRWEDFLHAGRAVPASMIGALARGGEPHRPRHDPLHLGIDRSPQGGGASPARLLHPVATSCRADGHQAVGPGLERVAAVLDGGPRDGVGFEPGGWCHCGVAGVRSIRRSRSIFSNASG